MAAPPMSVAMLTVGTRGDVDPFVALGQRMARLGHRVRVCTHEAFAKRVRAAGLDFHPLEGDPVKLSEWLSDGLLPNLLSYDEVAVRVPAKMAELGRIVESTWPACTAPTADGPFLPDLLLASPVVYGAREVAEALGIPMHVVFAQPWHPTGDFPHQMAGVGAGPRWLNRLTHHVVEHLQWLALRGALNRFRTATLGLEPVITAFELATHGLFALPFSGLWSPAVCPTPSDWPPSARVAGALKLPPAAHRDDAFERWRSGSDAPVVYVGFGSMLVDDRRRVSELLAAALDGLDVRLVVQAGWANLAAPDDPRVFAIGPCPHAWLFARVDAVVHHGGSGTTDSSLRAGRPTMVCPTGGDQWLWGARVHALGAGPPPVALGRLTAARLREGIRTLLLPEAKRRAARAARRMRADDGGQAATAAIHRGLPHDRLHCHVSLMLDPPEFVVAQFARDGVRYSKEVARATDDFSRLHDRVDWAPARHGGLLSECGRALGGWLWARGDALALLARLRDRLAWALAAELQTLVGGAPPAWLPIRSNAVAMRRAAGADAPLTPGRRARLLAAAERMRAARRAFDAAAEDGVVRSDDLAAVFGDLEGVVGDLTWDQLLRKRAQARRASQSIP